MPLRFPTSFMESCELKTAFLNMVLIWTKQRLSRKSVCRMSLVIIRAVISVRKSSPVFTFDVRPLKMTDKAFYEFCRRNKDFRFEMDKKGNLIIMPPTFLETSRKNAKINVKLGIWSEKDQTGIAFESDGMFILPNGAKR